MDSNDLEAIKERAEKANDPNCHSEDWLNRQLSLVSDVPALLAEVKRLREINAELLDACRSALNFLVNTHSRSTAWIDTTKMTKEQLSKEITGVSWEGEIHELFDAIAKSEESK